MAKQKLARLEKDRDLIENNLDKLIGGLSHVNDYGKLRRILKRNDLDFTRRALSILV